MKYHRKVPALHHGPGHTVRHCDRHNSGESLPFPSILLKIDRLCQNVHYRNPSTHKMSPWMRKVFIEVLPYYLLMRRPPQKGKKPPGADQASKGSSSSIMVRTQCQCHYLPAAMPFPNSVD